LLHPKCEIRTPAAELGEDAIREAAIEAGADDVPSDEDEHIICTAPNELGTVANALRAAGLTLTSEKHVSVCQNTTTISGITVARQAIKLYDLLDDYADTLNVFTNL